MVFDAVEIGLVAVFHVEITRYFGALVRWIRTKWEGKKGFVGGGGEWS